MGRRDGAFLLLLAGLLALSGWAFFQGLPSRSDPVATALQAVRSFPLTLEEIHASDLSLHPARYWAPQSDRSVLCTLCPAECRIAPGSRGACKVRYNQDGRLFTLVYGRPLALAADPIEKKPLFHVMPGSRAFSLATAGCNLGCVFCQNWSISQAFPEKSDHYVVLRDRFVHRKGFADRVEGGEKARTVSPKLLVHGARANGCDAIAYTYTEPTVFYEYMIDCAREARAKGLLNLWITCAYINEEPLRELCRWIDAANVDLKGFSESFYRTYCGARLAPVLRALKILKEEGVWVEVTNLVIPGANDSDQDLRGLSRWVASELGRETPLHFSRFHPDYKLKDVAPTPSATLRRAARIAREEGLIFVYIGNAAHLDGENTFCPTCGKRVIRRKGFEASSLLSPTGACPDCGTVLPGIWEGEKGEGQRSKVK